MAPEKQIALSVATVKQTTAVVLVRFSPVGSVASRQ
jgi:hypothetical protein